MRLGLAFLVLSFRDDDYGVIRLKQQRQCGRTAGVDFWQPGLSPRPPVRLRGDPDQCRQGAGPGCYEARSCFPLSWRISCDGSFSPDLASCPARRLERPCRGQLASIERRGASRCRAREAGEIEGAFGALL